MVFRNTVTSQMLAGVLGVGHNGLDDRVPIKRHAFQMRGPSALQIAATDATWVQYVVIRICAKNLV